MSACPSFANSLSTTLSVPFGHRGPLATPSVSAQDENARLRAVWLAQVLKIQDSRPILQPWHPTLIACLIMARYESLDAAASLTPLPAHPAVAAFPAPMGPAVLADLGEGFLPGSAPGVSAALTALKHACAGDLSAAHEVGESFVREFEAANPNDLFSHANLADQHQASRELFESQATLWGTSKGRLTAALSEILLIFAGGGTWADVMRNREHTAPAVRIYYILARRKLIHSPTDPRVTALGQALLLQSQVQKIHPVKA